MKLTSNDLARHGSGTRICMMALSALLLCTLLLWGGARAALAAEPLAAAPDGTAQIWVDAESGSARGGLTAIAVRSAGGIWADAVPTQTPFGSSSVFAAQPGAVDVRFRIAQNVTADIAVSYVDVNGVVLGERLLRGASLTPQLAGADGWIPWSALLEQPEQPTGDGDDGDDGGTGDGGGTPADADKLARSGAADTWPLGVIAAALLVVAGGVLLGRSRAEATVAVDVAEKGK